MIALRLVLVFLYLALCVTAVLTAAWGLAVPGFAFALAAIALSLRPER